MSASPLEIRAELAARFRALDDEVRHYPTPIARCDEQLPALLEARAEVRRLQSVDDDATLVAAYARALASWAQA